LVEPVRRFVVRGNRHAVAVDRFDHFAADVLFYADVVGKLLAKNKCIAGLIENRKLEPCMKR
jgi:hypothetical protein